MLVKAAPVLCALALYYLGLAYFVYTWYAYCWSRHQPKKGKTFVPTIYCQMPMTVNYFSRVAQFKYLSPGWWRRKKAIGHLFKHYTVFDPISGKITNK